MKLIGKQINEFAANTNDLPDYFGGKYYAPMEDKMRKVNGQLVAKRYNAILEIIADTKAKVTIDDLVIYVTYNNGNFQICRDLLTDTFLIPQLKLIA